MALSRFFLIVLASAQVAHAGDLWSAIVGGLVEASLRGPSSSSSSSSGGSGSSKTGNPWALGFGYGRQKNFEAGTINEDLSRGVLDNTRMYFLQGESQIAGPLIFFTELSYYDSRNLSASYDGNPNKSIELFMAGMTSSLLLRPNYKGLRPFMKGGYYIGHSVLSDPQESSGKGISKLADEEGKFMKGPAVGAGLEIDLGSRIGFRFSYDYFWFESDKYERLVDRSLKMEMDRLSAAIYFRP